MSRVLRRWEQRAESSVAARDATDGFAREALESQRQAFQRWLAEQTANHERVLADERARHQAEMQQLHAQFFLRVQSLELQVQVAQGLYRVSG